MAAAVTLTAQGIPVTLFESGPVPGGRARRITSQGNELDNGQHILIGAYTELFRLMRQVGVAPDALLRVPLEVRYAEGFHLRSHRLPAPLGLLAGLMLAKGISLAERIGAVRFMRALKKNAFRLANDTTVEELLHTHGQDGRMRRFLWGPVCVSALNTPIDQASARVFLAVLRDTLAGARAASDLVLPRVDLSQLFPEPAAAFVERHGGELRLRSPVADLAALEGFDAVIVAVGPHQVKHLLPELSVDYVYQPIYTCYLQYEDRVKLPFPMLGLASGLVQWAFDRGALLGEHGRLACVISAQGEHQALSLDELCARCHRELAQAIAGLGTPLWSRAIAEKRATIACTPNVRRPRTETSDPRVFLAGDYTDPDYPPTLEAAVRSGIRAARSSAAALVR
jgi:squalene-associated FAD-dependent desaturase